MIPSKSEIKRTAGMVEWFAASRCSAFVLKETSKGVAVEFDYGKAMLCITQVFHLHEIGKLCQLSEALSIDGASLTKNLPVDDCRWHQSDTIVLMICYCVYHNWTDLIPPIFRGIGDVAMFDNLTTNGVCFGTVMSMQISVLELAFTENNWFHTTFQNACHVCH
jgi:hypothetical protein